MDDLTRNQVKIFIWTFGIIEGLMIFLTLATGGFGSGGGFFIVLIFSIISSLLVLFVYSIFYRAEQFKEVAGYHYDKVIRAKALEKKNKRK
jgi:hypothetical protein